MASAAKKVFSVVGAVASIAAAIPGPHQPFAAGIAVAATLGESLIKAKPLTRSLVGNITEFSYNPDAGTPVVIGRSYFAGVPIHRDGYPAGASPTPNPYLTYAIEYSGAGPIQGFEQWLVDKEPVAFDGGGAATGKYAGYMWLKTSVGPVPQAAALTPPAAGMEGWDATSKASGHAHALWTLLFDDKDREGRLYAQGEPEPGAILGGIKGYDPRKDSTYPGGSGPHRWADPSDTAAHDAARATWEWSDDPFIKALNYALGYWHRDPDEPGSVYQKVGGVGLPIGAIDVPAFVEGANVCAANDWTLGGVFSLKDDKHRTLKAMLVAGGGEPLTLGGKLSCMVSSPKVSLATITEDQIVGETITPGNTSRRGRPNSYVPLYTSEDHDWEQIPADPVTLTPYVAAEGGLRQEELPFLFVQNAKHASQLAYYTMADARELPISTMLRPRWLGYKPGDCVTLAWPNIGYASQKVIVQKRRLDEAAAGGAIAVEMDFKTETDAKHPAALSLDPVPPAPPALTSTDLRSMPVPLAGDWTVTGATLTSGGGSIPVIIAEGGATNGNAAHVLFEYRVFGESDWTIQAVADASATRQEFPSVTPGTDYEVAISYLSRNGVISPRRIYGPVTAGSLVAGEAQAVGWSGVTDDDGHRPDDDADVTGDNVAAAITGQAPAATDGTIESGATNDKYGAALTTNYAPAHYRDNWAGRTRGEKKQRSTISGPGSSTYAWTSTAAPAPGEAGRVTQWFTGIDDNMKAVRQSTGAYPGETWGAWQISFGDQRLPYFGTGLRETDGGSLATLSNFKTGLGIAAGFTGQGSLATQNSLAYGGGYLTGFGTLAADSFVQFGSSKLRRSDGTTTAADGDYRTSLGIASGFFGQGALATRNTVGMSRILPQLGDGLIDDNFADEDFWPLSQGAAFTTLDILNSSKQIRFDLALITGSSITRSPRFPVRGGQFYYVGVSGRIEPDYDGLARVRLRAFDKSGANVLTQNFDFANGAGTPIGTLLQQTQTTIVTMPATAVEADWDFWCRADGGSPEGLSYFAKPIMREVRALGTDVARANGAVLTDTDAVTALGIAAGFTGQGGLATKNSAIWGSDFTSMPSWATSTVDISGIPRLRAAYVAKDDGSAQMETYWPATMGSDKTLNATAAAITGQGALATQNSLAYGGAYLTGFGPLAARGDVYFGSSYVLESSGGAQATLSNFKTGLGIASGFTGQGSLATKNSAIWGTDFTSMPNWATSTVDISGIPRLRASYVSKDDGSGQMQTFWPATTNADRTQNATAAGITGQGALATQNSLAYGGAYLTGFGPLAARGDVYFGSSYVLESSGGAQATLSNFKTGLGIAAGFTGQGAFATISQTALNNASRFSDSGRVGKLATTGRFNDTRGFTTQALLNSLNSFSLTPTYTVGGSNVTVNIPAATARVSSPSGPVTISYGASSGTVAFSANWYAYYIDADLAGNASPTLYLTTNKNDLLYPDRVFVARGTAPDSGGGGGSTPPGGGGGGGGQIP